MKPGKTVPESDSAQALAVLKKWSQQSDASVRKTFAREISDPLFLEALANDKEINVRSEVAGNASTPVSVLERLARGRSVDVRYAVSGNPSATTEILDKLARDRLVGILVASNPSASAEALIKLAKRKDPAYRYRVASNIAAPFALLERLAKDKDSSIRSAVASNPATPPVLLEQLSRDKSEWLHRDVACNPSTPAEVLEYLVKEGDEFVRAAVSGNPSTPAIVLEMLANDEDQWVREKLAYNRPKPVADLEMPAKDEEILTHSPSTPAELLEALVQDPDVYIRDTLAADPSTPSSALEVLAKDPESEVRTSVARNPATSPAVLEMLTKDENEEVCFAVTENPSASTSLLVKVLETNLRLIKLRPKPQPLSCEDSSEEQEPANHTGTVAICGWGYDLEWTAIGAAEFSLLTKKEVDIRRIQDIQSKYGSAGAMYGPANKLSLVVIDDIIRRKIRVPVKLLEVTRVEFETDYMLVSAQESNGTWYEYEFPDQYDDSKIQMAGTRLLFPGKRPIHYDFAGARYGDAKVSSGYDFMGMNYDPDWDGEFGLGDVSGRAGEIFIVDKAGRYYPVNVLE